MFNSKKHLSRRTFLHGAGVVVGLPLLDAMIPAQTLLARTAASPTPRLGFVYFPHGTVLDQWTPATTGRAFDVPPILKPLEAFKDQMTIVSGLRNKAGESDSPHGITAGTWLGCTPPAKQHSPLAGTSADQLAARHVGRDTAFPSLELAVDTGGACDPSYGCSYGHTISFRSPTQPLPMEYNPRRVFSQLFGQGDTAAGEHIVNETRSILDSITGDAAALRRTLGGDDRVKVGQYLDSVRAIERRIQKLEPRDVSSLDLPDAPVGAPSDFNAHLDLMFDLIALAYQANLTRVATFMMGREVSMRTFNHIGIADAFHPLSHHGNKPANLERLARVYTYHSEVFGRFVKRLAEMPDGDGSMLDHSILLYGSNMSDGNTHNADPLPSAVFGRACGKIKGGQHLKYPQDMPLANLLLTLLNRAGLPIESMGDSTGQLTEV